MHAQRCKIDGQTFRRVTHRIHMEHVTGRNLKGGNTEHLEREREEEEEEEKMEKEEC